MEKQDQQIFDDLNQYQSGGYPVNKLIVIEDEDGVPNVCAFIVDLEMDVFKAEFHLDGEIQLKTEKFTYLSVTEDVLYKLIDLSSEAEDILRILSECFDEETSEYVKWKTRLRKYYCKPEKLSDDRRAITETVARSLGLSEG